MNAALQALFRIPKLVNCLRSRLNNAKNCKIKKCIPCMVVSLYGDTNSSKVACSPYKLYGALKQTNLRFSELLNGQHQDAHEFLILLNQELEKKQPHSMPWFSRNFTFNLTTHIVCNSCGKVHESVGEATELALHVVASGTVQAAVDAYFSHEDIEYLCEDCRTYDIVKKKHFIVSAPTCLCLQLKRFSDQGTKITDSMEISSELSLKEHFLDNEVSEWKYKLVAVVNHFGQSRNVGHYNTIALTVNGEHLEIDDRSVRKVSSNLLSGKDVYILFYEMIEVKARQIQLNFILSITNCINILNTKDKLITDELVENVPQINSDSFEDQSGANEKNCTSNEIVDCDGIVKPNQTEVNLDVLVLIS